MGKTYKVMVELTEAQIQKAVNRVSGRLSDYDVECILRGMIDKKVKSILRKNFGSMDDLIKSAFDNVDWKNVVKNHIEQRIESSNDW